MPSILSFENVSKEYVAEGERVAALRDVSLQVTPGEFIAVIGRSGCGKSTLLHLAGAMDLPTAGKVLLDGQNTSALDDRGLTKLRRNRVGFVFQSFQLLDNMSVIENVELPMLLAGASSARERARESLEWVGMHGYQARLPHQLSGGEMQRVAIARALVHSPGLVIADEPTGNLDTATGDVIVQLLRRIAYERGTTVLMATHSAEAAAAANRIVRLRDGRIAG